MIALCVDLDGTLIREDTATLATKKLIKQSPLSSLLLPLWLLKGLAFLKQQVAKRVELEPCQLTYNEKFLQWIKAECGKGREIILVTATDAKFAHAVADYLGIFSVVLASDGKINLRSANKEAALNQRYGKGQYDYAGNDTPDLAVWRSVHKAIIVDPTRPDLIDRCRKIATIDKIFD